MRKRNIKALLAAGVTVCAIVIFAIFRACAPKFSSTSSPAQVLSSATDAIMDPRVNMYWRPDELGVKHYTLLGELTNGEHVNLHLWLTAAQTNSDAGLQISLQGFGMFETVDGINTMTNTPHARISGKGAWELKSEEYMHLEALDGKGERIRVSILEGARSGQQQLMTPFHLEAKWNATPGAAVAVLRVRGWRRFLPLPLADLLEAPAGSCPGRFHVTTIASPELAPAMAARLIAWHVRAHVALGFSCEMAYIYWEHLDVLLADREIVRLIQSSQLRLVLVEGFFARYTLNADEKRVGAAGNLINAAENEPQVQPYNPDQVQIHAHALLASVRKEAWLLIIDLDEYLAIDRQGSVESLFPQCFGERSAEIKATNIKCTSCEWDDVPCEPGLWMNATDTAKHPLQHYVKQSSVQASAVYDYWTVKSVVRPDEIINFEIHIGTERNKSTPLKADVAGGCGLLVLHARDQLMFREKGSIQANTTNEWRWMLDKM